MASPFRRELVTGDKRYLPRSRVSGASHLLRNQPTGHTWMCKDYLTALSVRDALEQIGREDTVIVCFSARNILQVWKRLRKVGIGIMGRVVADHDLYTCPSPECHARWDAPFDLLQPRCPV